MDTLTGQKKIFQLYDKSLSRIETPQGTLTLVSVFLPFFVEMLLTNSMGTVNTLVLSHYSDEAVASVGAANQLMGMIFTFYTVISTGASILHGPHQSAKKSTSTSPSFAVISSNSCVFTIFIFFILLFSNLSISQFFPLHTEMLTAEDGEITGQSSYLWQKTKQPEGCFEIRLYPLGTA